MATDFPQIFLDMQATQGGGGTGLGSVATALAAGLRVQLNDRFNFVPIAPSNGRALRSVVDRIYWEQIAFPSSIKEYKSSQISNAIVHSLCLGSPIRANLRTIATVYDFIPMHDPHSFSRGFAGWYYRTYLPYCYRKASKLLCISEVVRQEAISILKRNPDDVYLLPLFVRPELLSAFTEISEQPRNCVITVGTHESRKNLDTIIKAYARLSSNLQNEFPLIIIGKHTALTPKFKQLAINLKCSSSIRFIDYVSLSDLALYYKRACLNIFISKFEGFGLPPLEAIAGGCPSIISNIPVHTEVYGKHFELIDPDDIEAITDQIQKNLTDGEYSTNNIKKAATLLDKYSIERAVTACSYVYYDLIG